METFTEYLKAMENPQHRARTREVLDWVAGEFPELETKVAWNQPMFTDHGTFIIGFSSSSKHLAVSPEQAGMEHFSEEIKAAGYRCGKMLFRIPWEEPVNHALLRRIIQFNRQEKAGCKTFWR